MDDRPAHAGNVPHTIALTLVVVAVALVGLALLLWRDLFLLLFAGVVLATALQPACDLLSKRCGLRHALSVVIVYASVSAIFVGLAVWLVPQLWNQVWEMWAKLPGWYEHSREWLTSSSQRTLSRVGSWLPEQLPAFSMSALETSSKEGTKGGNGPLALIRQIVMSALAVLTIGVLAFYWTLNRELTLRTLLDLVPEHRRTFYSELSDTLFMKLGAYVRGQLILCAIVGAMSFIVYWSIGLPYALVLALVAGLLEAIPVFGPTLGAVPAILVALSVGPQTTLLVIAGATLIQTLENYLLVPKVMDRSVGISAVVTLLALIAFGALFGLLGAVLAIPLAAIVQTLFDRLVLQADFKEKDVEISRDFTGVMRYQLLDLIQDVRRQQRSKNTDVEDATTSAFNEIEALATALDDLLVDEGAEPLPPAPALAQVRSA